MLNGISKTVNCVLGVMLGCSMLSSASAQMTFIRGNSLQAGAVSVGQPRIVDFRPIGGASNMAVSNNFSAASGFSANTGFSLVQPSANVSFGSPVMFSNGSPVSVTGFSGNSPVAQQFIQQGSTVSPMRFSTAAGFSNLGVSAANTTSGYGRIVRYRYTVPVYGPAKAQATSSCGPCGNVMTTRPAVDAPSGNSDPFAPAVNH